MLPRAHAGRVHGAKPGAQQDDTDDQRLKEKSRILVACQNGQMTLFEQFGLCLPTGLKRECRLCLIANSPLPVWASVRRLGPTVTKFARRSGVQ